MAETRDSFLRSESFNGERKNNLADNPFYSLPRRRIFGSNASLDAYRDTPSFGSKLKKSMLEYHTTSQRLLSFRQSSSKSRSPPSSEVTELLQAQRDKLLLILKKQVKQLAEEAVLRKYIHEESSSVTSFCAAVDACLRFGLLKRRGSREPVTLFLLQDISKFNPEAADIVQRIQTQDGNFGNIWNLFRGKNLDNFPSSASSTFSTPTRMGNTPFDSIRRKTNGNSHHNYKWIRMALFDKTLDKIVDFLVENAGGYYERVAILTHPCDAYLFAHLLRGPCTHDYTRIRTSNYLWTDPSARELLQRQKIYAAGMRRSVSLHTHKSRDYFLNHQSSTPFKASEFETIGLLSEHLHKTPHSTSPTLSSRVPLGMDCLPHFGMAIVPEHISPASLLYSLTTSSDYFKRPRFLTSQASSCNSCNNPNAEYNISLDRFSDLESPNPLVAPSSSTKLTVAKDYVESLLQNETSPLIYGKNNVTVQPNMSSIKILGYLSLHKSSTTGTNEGLLLKWVPNRAMSTEAVESQKKHSSTAHYENGIGLHSTKVKTDYSESGQKAEEVGDEIDPESLIEVLQGSTYWDFALNIDFKKVVYLHCHRHYGPNEGGSLVLVREDGVQFPPLFFPSFSQVITFLQCLEQSLAPQRSLKPPLADVDFEANKGGPGNGYDSGCEAVKETNNKALPAAPDSFYCCFRIKFVEPRTNRNNNKPPLFKAYRHNERTLKRRFLNTISLSDLTRVQDTKTLLPSLPHTPDTSSFPVNTDKTTSSSQCTSPVNAMASFESTCSSMRYQILSRVFCGWLAYSRSINQIRKGLKDTVFPQFLCAEASPLHPEPMTADFWRKFRKSRSKADLRELHKRIYFGGCDHSIRREVWPFLLGHYPWSANDEEIAEIDRTTQTIYEKSVSEWLAVEAIIRQQEKEANRERELIELETNLRLEAERCQPPPSPSPLALSASTRTSRWSSGSRPNISPSDLSLPIEQNSSENKLTEVWKRMKRKLSTVTLSGISNKNSPTFVLPDSELDSSKLNNATPNMISAKPCFDFDKTVNNGDHSDLRLASIDLTDETDDCPLTTSDEETDSSFHRPSRSLRRSSKHVPLPALSRPQSCPNKPNPNNLKTIPGSNIDSPASPTHLDCKFPVINGNRTPGTNANTQVQAGRGELFKEKSTRQKRRSRNAREDLAGTCYSNDVLEALAINIHRIDKDVARCDRNYPYFAEGLSDPDRLNAFEVGGLCVSSMNSSANLYRLRTIMCTWTWEHMDTGYVQGMCDLLAPLLVILDDEALTHACFCQLMQAMLANFPLPSSGTSGVVPPDQLETVVVLRRQKTPIGGIALEYVHTRPRIFNARSTDAVASPLTSSIPVQPVVDYSSSFALGSSRIYQKFQRLRALLEVFDPSLAKHMNLSEENAHLYFYRWLLLDFKRELKYNDVFLVWETIWTSRRLVSDDFGVFIAFALIQCYRDIIIFYCMDYTDIIRFYNERAELHDVPRLLSFARDMIHRLQTLIAST